MGVQRRTSSPKIITMSFKSYKKELSDKSLIKYKGKPPSIELVQKVLKDSELSKDRFETVYGLPDKTLERYILGHRGLPTVYWHIFYEFNNLEKFYRNFKAKNEREKKESKKSAPVIAETNKNLIDAIRARISQR